jgi:hypothetical protein
MGSLPFALGVGRVALKVSLRLSETHFLQGGTRVAPLDIGHDAELDVRDAIERHLIVLDLVHGAWRAKSILLPHSLPVGLSAVCGPPHDELLGACLLRFGKDEPQTVQRVGAIKHEPDDLLARMGGPPPGRCTRHQRGFNGAGRILGGELDLGQRRHIEPWLTQGGGVSGVLKELQRRASITWISLPRIIGVSGQWGLHKPRWLCLGILA